MSANSRATDVAIVGGGPAGLMLAIELGCRRVRSVILEEDMEGPDFPKASATSSRTMAHLKNRCKHGCPACHLAL